MTAWPDQANSLGIDFKRVIKYHLVIERLTQEIPQ